MRRNRVIGWCAVAGIFIAGVVIIAFRHAEPAYQGKRLSEWLRDFDNGWDFDPDVPAVVAVRQMGTNALPTLLEMIKHRDSSFKQFLMKLSGKQAIIHFNFQPADRLHMRAAIGIYALGPNAKSAVPDLIALARNPSPNPGLLMAVSALAGIGPEAKDAVPVLVKSLTHTNSEPLPAMSAYALGRIGPEAKSAIAALTSMLEGRQDQDRLAAAFALARINSQPVDSVAPLVDGLRNTNSQTRSFAAVLIGEFGGQARTLIPPLERVLSDSDADVRRQAGIALKKIDPEAAAKAGVK